MTPLRLGIWRTGPHAGELAFYIFDENPKPSGLDIVTMDAGVVRYQKSCDRAVRLSLSIIGVKFTPLDFHDGNCGVILHMEGVDATRRAEIIRELSITVDRIEQNRKLRNVPRSLIVEMNRYTRS